MSEFNSLSILLLVVAALIGAAIALVVNHFIAKRHKTNLEVKFSNNDIANEILDVRTSQRVLYAFGPIIALLLLLLGYDNFKSVNDYLKGSEIKKVLDEAREIVNDHKSQQYLHWSDLQSELGRYYRVEQSVALESKLDNAFENKLHVMQVNVDTKLTTTGSAFTQSLNESVKNKIDRIEFDGLKNSLIPGDELRRILNDKVHKSDLETSLNQYYLKSEGLEQLKLKVDKSLLDQNYTPKAELNTVIKTITEAIEVERNRITEQRKQIENKIREIEEAVRKLESK